MFYAHTRDGAPENEWEPLEDHLRKVAEGGEDFAGAAGFADAFGAGAWGRLLGLWHDLGKYSAEFQARLRWEKASGPAARSAPRVDHSTAGARHAVNQLGEEIGRLLAYCIAGHHGGLLDNVDPTGGGAGLVTRLENQEATRRITAAPQAILEQRRPDPPFKLAGAEAAFQLSVFCRMLYSCLVDADYLATEAWMNGDRTAARVRPPVTMHELRDALSAYLTQRYAHVPDSPVNRSRAAVLEACRSAAEWQPGLFSLTVPTGGGKTLSSLTFALEHATRHGLRRVIYAIPFTCIVEQNARVFREALAQCGPGVILEHHSNLDPDDDTLEARLAAENWDAPIVVTTNVQLFESLFASKPARCRKLHRIPRSVIVLDEAQALPVELLKPTLAMLTELCRNYGCTVVLCTATQPAIQERLNLPAGLNGVREIVPDTESLFARLRRVNVQQLGLLADEALATRLGQHKQVLCIVNTRGHAANLFELLRGQEVAGAFHLSTRMCAAHRSSVLNAIRRRLLAGAPCRVVSTQLIEAGVDIDFPVVYRAPAGLDSIAQAAGRCNREGRLQHGEVFLFDTQVPPFRELRPAADVAAEVRSCHSDPLSLEAIEHYFRLHYWQRGNALDQYEIMKYFTKGRHGWHFQFREAARDYRFIRDTQVHVVVPYGRRGCALLEKLRSGRGHPDRMLLRQLQRYCVGVYEHELAALHSSGAVSAGPTGLWLLDNPAAYDRYLGLRMGDIPYAPGDLYV